MPLQGYTGPPFVIGNQVDLLDVFMSDGSATNYPLLNKSYSSANSIIQAGNQYINQIGPGAFSKSSSPSPKGSITLANALAMGTVLVVPGSIRFVFKAYGAATAQGTTDPNVSTTPIYLLDITTINANTYLPTTGQTSILIELVDNDPSFGGINTWLQLGYATPTGSSSGLASGTWGSAGATLNLAPISGTSILTSSTDAGATSIPVASGADFPVSQTAIFVQLDTGLSTQEIVQVTNISGNTLTTTPCIYAHAASAQIYHCGYVIWGQLTLPTNLSSFANYYDVSVDVICDTVPR